MLRYIFSFFSFFIPFSFVAAVSVTSPTENLPGITDNPAFTIAQIIKFGIEFASVIAIGAIIWASIQMILAAGEDEKIKKSRKIIMYALIGLVLTGLAYGIVDMVTNLNLQPLQ